MAISFKGAHFPPDIILMGVRWYVAYPFSYRHVEAAVPGEPLSDVISICYILGFRKDNAKFFSKLSLNR